MSATGRPGIGWWLLILPAFALLLVFYIAPIVQVLTISVTAKVGESTAFLVEVKQAGVFGVRNLGEDDYRRAVASVAPNVLFPYARAVVSQLVSLGGFPQMLLPPVNFDALYARSLAEAQQKALNS